MKTFPHLVAAAPMALAVVCGSAAERPLTHVWTAHGFAQPESAVHDVARDRLIVSNIDGHPGEADGRGFLSIVSPEGKVVERRWITGLDAPKGMAISGGRLYLSDLTELHVIDLETGTLERTLSPEGARFLNDVTSTPSGRVFVSDMMTHTIYELGADGLVPWLRGGPLAHPNGVLALGTELYVGNWGEGLRADFTTEHPGAVIAIDIETGHSRPLGAENAQGNIDGLAAVGGHLVASDWVRGTLLLIAPARTRAEAYPLEPGIADIASMGDRLLVPQMRTGEVSAYRLLPRHDAE